MKILIGLRAFVAALAVIALTPAWAQQPAAQNETTVSPASQGPALWKVADEDTTIYLFGTVHLLPANVDWYDARIAEALKSADSLVTELISAEESEQIRQEYTSSLQKGLLPKGVTLRSLLTPEQTSAYENALAKLGYEPDVLDQYKPWYAGLNLALIPLRQQGYDPQLGVERVLLQKVPGIAREALETAQYQLGLFDGLSLEVQIDFMMGAVAGLDEVKPMLDALVEEWSKGNVDAVADLMNAGFAEPELAQALLYDRNANWARWIVERLKNPGTVFVAVGSGHLAGKDSVQDFLKASQVEVDRVH